MSNILDPLILFITFTILVFFAVISYFIFSTFTGTGLINADIQVGAEGFYDAINGFGLFVVLAIIGATIGAAYMIKTNPIFFIVAILLIFIQATILPEIVNVMTSLISSPDFDAATTQFSTLIWLMQISPALAITGSLLAAIVGMRAE